MKRLIFLLALSAVFAGCQQQGSSARIPTLAENQNTFRTARGHIHDVVCIDKIQYLQNSSNGNLTIKLGFQGKPMTCDQSQESDQ